MARLRDFMISGCCHHRLMSYTRDAEK